MIYSIDDLLIKFKEYKNPYQKIQTEENNGRLFKAKRGLYSDDPNKDYLLIANKLTEPSYISFDYALYYYGLIPERVYLITSASYNKSKTKTFIFNNRTYTYYDIKKDAYPEGYTLIVDEFGNAIKMATKEKALCDKLSTIPQVAFVKRIKELLFNDLRVDPNEFFNLDLKLLMSIASLYKKVTLNTLVKYVRGIIYE